MSRLGKFAMPWAVALAVALCLSAWPGAALGQADDRQPKEFVTGSGKADFVIAGDGQHLSFTAHSTGPNCEATGSVEYKVAFPEGTLHVKGRVLTLLLTAEALDVAPQPGVGFAFFTAEVQYATLNGESVATPPYVWFHASDSGQPGGMGDTILFEGFHDAPDCLIPLGGQPIRQGNIVIQAEPLI